MSQQKVLAKQESKISPSSQAGFPVSLTQLQENIKALLMSVTSGQNIGESFAKFIQPGLLVKTFRGYSQQTIDGSLETFSGTWPKWGTLLDGVCSELAISAHPINERDCLLWRTPDAGSKGNVATPTRCILEGRARKNQQIRLVDQVSMVERKMWPTPRGSEGGVGLCGGTGHYQMIQAAVDKGQMTKEGMKQITAGNGGQLNPDWVETLQGFPVGWTDLDGRQDSGQLPQLKK